VDIVIEIGLRLRRVLTVFVRSTNGTVSRSRPLR
jgi:hypothetical protein